MRKRLLTATLAAAVLLSGCAETEPESLGEISALPTTEATVQESAAPTTSPAATQPSATDSAPSALLPTITGGQIDLNELLGQDAVLWFWAPW